MDPLADSMTRVRAERSKPRSPLCLLPSPSSHGRGQSTSPLAELRAEAGEGHMSHEQEDYRDAWEGLSVKYLDKLQPWLSATEAQTPFTQQGHLTPEGTHRCRPILGQGQG